MGVNDDDRSRKLVFYAIQLTDYLLASPHFHIALSIFLGAENGFYRSNDHFEGHPPPLVQNQILEKKLHVCFHMESNASCQTSCAPGVLKEDAPPQLIGVAKPRRLPPRSIERSSAGQVYSTKSSAS